MIRHIALFLVAFAVGATIALVIRTARHRPYDGSGGLMGSDPVAGQVMAAPPAVTPTMPAADHDGHPMAAEAMPVTSAAMSMTMPAMGHDQDAPSPATTAVPGMGPVNTICAICGMPVDPAIPTATYRGKTIGFGCPMCPPKFAREPDRYGPFYLKNQVAE